MMRLALLAFAFTMPLAFVRYDIKPYEKMAYPTVGDWRWDGWRLRITSARLSSRRYEALVLVHETVEALLCAMSGVSEQAVTDFDIEFERVRTPKDLGEPGDDYWAPYRTQHRIATAVERALAAALLVDWADYEREVESL